jgi:hypothetical protein
MTCGIYRIDIGDEFYIGSSKQIELRFSDGHLVDLANGNASKLMNNKYRTVKSAQLSILEKCSPQELMEREQWYIDALAPTLNRTKKITRPKGRNKTFLIKDPFGTTHRYTSIKECCVNNNLYMGTVSELLNGKRFDAMGWVRHDCCHMDVYRRYGVLDQDDNQHIVRNIPAFAKQFNLSAEQLRLLLQRRRNILHHRGFHLPETNVKHYYRTKYIEKDGVILKYNHGSDFIKNADLIKYKLRPDSIYALSRGFISNHRGWRLHNTIPE